MHVIVHAKIYTFDARYPTATAVAIEGDRVVDIGDDFYILNQYPRHSDVFDAGGYTIIPGLADAHIHLDQYAFSLQKVDCDTPSRQECLARVAQRAAVTPPGEWILGHGWNQNNWVDGFGTAAELDRVAPDQPVYLTAKSLHAAWTSSSALRAAGITKDSHDPAGGKVLRGPDGQPSGILLESAMQLVSGAIPQPTPEQRTAVIKTAISRLSEMGITFIHDFDQRACFVALQELYEHQELDVRVLKNIQITDLPHAVALGMRSGFGGPFLRMGGVKIFSDGALGPRTAAMLQAYDSEPANRGILLIDPDELFEIGCQAADSGFSLAVHAIGDRANRAVLDTFARLNSRQPHKERRAQLPGLRHRIEHVQLIHPKDIHRLAELGVIASMQPLHATSDMNMANRFWGERSSTAYAWNSLLEHKTILAFGSDAPVESPDPFAGLYAAVTRRRADGSPGSDGWYPSQRISRWQALQAYTLGPALAAGVENHVGKLSPGYFADLLVLEQDPFVCDAGQLKQMRPTATMLGGNWVYQA
jgi:predicted amidohydrolase YtcJ